MSRRISSPGSSTCIPSSGHSLLRRIQRGIGVGHRLGDENPAAPRANRAGRSARRATDSSRSNGHAGSVIRAAPAPAAKAVIEILPADQPVGEVEAPGRGHLLDRQHMLVDGPHMADLRLDPGLGAAVEIGMLAKPAGHRLVGQVAAGQAGATARRWSSAKCCSARYCPRPFAGLVVECEDALRKAPRLQPATAPASPGRAAD